MSESRVDALKHDSLDSNDIQAWATLADKLERELAEAREFADAAQVARQELIKELAEANRQRDRFREQNDYATERVLELRGERDDMEKRARAAEKGRDEAFERAAKVCDDEAERLSVEGYAAKTQEWRGVLFRRRSTAQDCAAAIRVLLNTQGGVKGE